MIDTRRSFLARAGLAPLALLGAARLRAAAPVACYDANALPFSQKSRRRSVGYIEVSTEPARRCSGCNFYTVASPGCGSCSIIGGPVNAGAVCGSFAAKKAA